MTAQTTSTVCRLIVKWQGISKPYGVSRGSVAGDRFLHSDRARHEALPQVTRYMGEWDEQREELSSRLILITRGRFSPLIPGGGFGSVAERTRCTSQFMGRGLIVTR